MIRAFLLGLVLSLVLPLAAGAGDVRLAVASNMLPAARALGAAFTDATGHAVHIAHGATGRLYTQITRGAPFDIFLSADADRPARLAADGRATAHRTYALGRLTLVGHGLTGSLADILHGKRIAIADPRLAPYGQAAAEVLERAGIDTTQLTLLHAENVGQVAVWVETGNAEIGFLASALVPALAARAPIETRPLPQNMHRPIRQDAALLSRAAGNPAARAFWDWLGGPDAAEILVSQGFTLP